MTQYASFGKRFLAALLDGIILGIINGLISGVLGKNSSVAALIWILITWLYYAI